MNLPFKLIAYINGIRFYPAGCNYTSTEGQHAQFTLTVPAVSHWAILPERSHCVVFYTDPVSNSWRMLCEGEFVADSRQKSATGARYRALAFRATHAIFESATYSGMAGLTSGDLGHADAVGQQLTAYASGVEIRTSTENGKSASEFDLVRNCLIKFITDYSKPGTRISTFLPEFLTAVMQQLPVDAFYAVARRLKDKMFALPDDEIGSVIDASLFTELIRQSWGPNSLTPNTRIEDIIRNIENLVYYQHITVPSPPIYIDSLSHTGFRIPEMMFIPQLYTVVPPACNVVFRDQITDISGGRNFLSEPTRVITQLEASIVGAGALPLFIMSNDTERSVNVSEIAGSKINQTNTQAPPSTLVMHDFLTLEEYTRGVIPVQIAFPFQNLFTRSSDAKKSGSTTVDPTNSRKANAKIVNFVSHSTRHFYDVARGAQRRMQVNCTFLPYIVPGFPCLIEDTSGSFWGIVHSVTHTLLATGQPSTTLDISHVRETYIIDGHVRNSYNPLWLNKAFLPSNVNSTYEKIFGNNAPDAINAGPVLGAHAAMVPDSIITAVGASATDVPLNADDQINLDAVAAYVIPTPHYTADGRIITAAATVSVAEKIRATNDVQMNCLKFQYRAGVSLTQFAQFHNLKGIGATLDSNVGGSVSDHPDYVFSKTPPPSDLSDGSADRLFGTPFRMIFAGRQAAIDPTNPYGVYRLQQIGGHDITYFRQQAALTIRAAIDQTISEG